MDALVLSRLQFAMASMFHFLFVPLTLGLVILVAIFELLYIRTGDEDYKTAAKFWGKLFLINFALGVVTGITLEFQFGTNWRYYSEFMGDIFGSLLAIEATLAFFLESTFIAVWFFGWDKLSKKMHNLAIWLVALGSNVSAFWILTANAWMQHPVGYRINQELGRAELTNFWAVITNSYAFHELLHTLSASYVLAGFFVLGISAYHLLKKSHVDFFKKSFRVAAVWSAFWTIFLIVHSHFQASDVAEKQPEKLAAMEALWETQNGAPWVVFAIVDEANERNVAEILPIPRALSLLSYHDPNAPVKGLKEWPRDERPPVSVTFYSFRLMVFIGLWLLFMAIWAYVKRNEPENHPKLLKLLLWTIPLPYLAIQFGWLVTEMGRQPWIVYRVMRVSEAVSPVPVSFIWISFISLLVLYALLGAVDFYLLAKNAKLGPDAVK